MQSEFQGEPIVRAHCAWWSGLSRLQVAGCQTPAHWVHRSLGLLRIGHFAVILKKVETVDIILVSTEETGLGNVSHLPTVLMIQSGF